MLLSTDSQAAPLENNKIYLLHRAVCHVSVNLNTHNAFVYAVFSGAFLKLSLRVLPQPPNKTGMANFSSALLFVSLPSLSTNFVPPVNDLSSTRDFLRCCAFQCSAVLLLLSSAAFAFQRPRMLGRSATCNRREHYGETIVAGRACEPRRRLERREICGRHFSPSNNAGASSISMIRLGGTPTTNDVSELWTDNSMEHSGIDIEEKKEAEDAGSSSDDGNINSGGGAAAAAAPTDTRSHVRSSSSRAPDDESSRAAREPKKVPLRPPPGAPLRRSERVAGSDTLTIPKDVAQVGDPQRKEEKSYSIETILKELQAIQNTGYVPLARLRGLKVGR